ncbi:MAG: hypothetical protein WCF75_03710, partial [Pseudolabrys sp.]
MFQAEDNIPIRKRLIAATHARQQISRMVSYGFSGRKFSNGSDRPSRDWQLISAAVGQTIVAICDLPPPKREERVARQPVQEPDPEKYRVFGKGSCSSNLALHLNEML